MTGKYVVYGSKGTGSVPVEATLTLLWLADSHPEARLSPTMASHARPAFLRWMAFVSSAIYALYWIRDEPKRIIDDPALGKIAKARIADRFVGCWKTME